MLRLNVNYKFIHFLPGKNPYSINMSARSIGLNTTTISMLNIN